MSQSAVTRPLKILLSCAGVLLAFTAAEGLSRVFYGSARQQAYRQKPYRVADGVLAKASALDRPELALAAAWPTPTLPPRDENPPVRSFTYSDDGGRIVDPQIGMLLAPRTTGRVQKVGDDGHVIYDVTYTTDEFGRRTVVQPVSKTRQRNVLLLGGSDVAGHGLHDRDTMASQLARAQTSSRVFNYAVEGWGPANVLRYVRLRDVAKELPAAKETVAVYWLSRATFDRSFPNLFLYRTLIDTTSALPYFTLERGELKGEGTFAQRGLAHWSLSAVSRSALLAALGVESPSRYTLEHFELYAELLEGIHRGLSEKLGRVRFVVVFPKGYPLSWVPVAAPLLRQRGIQTLDYHTVDLTRYTAAWTITPDYHPSAIANELMMRQLAKDLSL